MPRDVEKWFPNCIHLDKPMGYSTHGHVMPCCWAVNDDPGFAVLQKEKLKLQNNDSVEEILRSEEWRGFQDILLNEPESAPRTCWKYCGNGKDHRIKETLDT